MRVATHGSAARLFSVATWLLGIAAVCATLGCSPSKPAVTAQSDQADRPALTNVYQVGPVIDVLAKVDPRRDAVKGDFRLADGDLIVPAVRSSQLNVDVGLPEQYEMKLEVAKTAGNESLNLGITMGVHQAVVVIEGWGKKTSALNKVDNRLGEDNETSTQTSVFPDNSRRTIRVIVRKESILVDVDDGVFIDYRGAPSRLSFDEKYFQRPQLNQLMIGSWETEYRVSKWTLTPLGDERVDYNRIAQLADAESEDRTARPGTSTPTNPGGLQSATSLASNDRTTTNNDSEESSDSRPEPNDPPAVTEEPVEDGPVQGAKVAWQAAPDPYPQWDGTAVSKLAIPVPKGLVVVPDVPSPFFMIGIIDHPKVEWKLYDVRQGSEVGEVFATPSGDFHSFQLGPSGQYLQCYTGVAFNRRLFIQSFATGETVYEADSPEESSQSLRDYLMGDHRILQVRRVEDGVQFQTVDLRTGEAGATWIRQRESASLRGLAVSPGGRFAVANWNNQFVVYDLQTGQGVGEFDGPEGFVCEEAMAFPIDGSELALVGTVDGRLFPLLWCIDWRTGKTSLFADVEWEMESLSNNYLYGPPLEWFPDKSLLLFYGQDVIDRQTGKFLFQIPSNMHWEQPRRTAGDRAVLGMMLSSDPDLSEYRTVPLPAQALETSLAVIRAGGNASDIGLSPLTIPEMAGARVFSTSENTSPLNVEETTPVEFPEVKLPMRLVQLRTSDNELQRIEFADPAEAKAIAHFTLDNDNRKTRQDRIVRYDLKRSKPTGSIPIRSDFRLVAVSPDGNRALVGKFNEVGAYSRLDVVDVAGPKHVAGWKPYEKEPYVEDVAAGGQPEALNPQTVTWVRFADNDRVVTVNPAGKMVVWQLPGCTPLFVCEDWGSPIAASQDRRYVVGAQASALHLFDVQNGRWAGKLEPEGAPLSIARAGLSPDNRELVAAVGYQGRQDLVVWDLSNGVVVQQFELPYSTISSGWSPYKNPKHRELGLEFRRDGYLMLDDLYLVDRTGGTVSWLYNLGRGKHVANSPDQRTWFTEFMTTNDQGQRFEFWLHALEAPSDAVLDLVKTSPAAAKQRPVGRSVLRVSGENAELTKSE